MDADVKARKPVLHSPDCAALEDRILMSANPIAELGIDPEMGSQEVPPLHLIAPLSDGASGGDPAPEALPIPVLVISEDANNYTADLSSFFADEPGPGGSSDLTYLLLANSKPELFDHLAIDQERETLHIDFAGNAEGDAVLTLRAVDSSGQSVDNEFEINIQPINDRPTTSGFSDVFVTGGTESTVIDLFAAFDDVEDADELLTFEVVSLGNPALFDAVTIDDQAGTLTLDYAQGALGSSTVVLRATDTEGLSVEMTAAGSEFSVHQFLGHADSTFRPDFAEMGIDSMRLLTAGAFFDYDPATGYDASSLNEGLLRHVLNNFVPEPYDNPVVLDIESSLYDNSPEGRDNLARVLEVAHDERPDLDFGFYRLMPERNWWAPYGYQRGLDEIANGNPDGWWAYNLNNGNNYQAQYDNWLARNELYRTEEVSSSLGGGTLAERVDVVYPSLYTVYEPEIDLWSDPKVQYWHAYAEHNIAEARKFDVPVTAFISPSVAGLGESFLPKEFVRHQLDTLYELTDGIILFGAVGQDPFTLENSGWLEAVDEFMQYIRTPTAFTVAVQPPTAPTANAMPPTTPQLGELAGEIDLWAAFDDPNHDDHELTYSVLSVSNSSNLASWTLRESEGTIEFMFSADATGYSDIIVQATDPDGWYAQNTLRVSLPNLGPAGSYVSYGIEIFEDGTLSLSPGTLPGVSAIIESPLHADAFEITADGALLYTPSPDWSGLDHFRYEAVVIDGIGGFEPASSLVDVQINVREVNDVPVATPTPDTDIPPGAMSVVFDLSRMFTDIDDPISSLQFHVVGLQGDLIDSVDVNNQTDLATVHLVPGAIGASQVQIEGVDPHGAYAVNTLNLTRAAAVVTPGGSPHAYAGTNTGSGSLPGDILRAQGGLQTTSEAQSEDATAVADEQASIVQMRIGAALAAERDARQSESEDEDLELVAVPLLSLLPTDDGYSDSL